jgi:GNAT superfamily N-acetyltransferase
MPAPTVRPTAAADRDAWLTLWRAYCAFYRADVPQAVTDATWSRMLTPGSGVAGLVAEVAGEVVGFANYVVHPYTWSQRPAGYLEDLYVREDVRGQGVGAGLIQALLDLGQAQGWGRLYWMTEETNAAARKLYDRFVGRDEFVRYLVKLAP